MGAHATGAVAQAGRRSPARRYVSAGWPARTRPDVADGSAMRLGLNLGYWGLGNDADNLALARRPTGSATPSPGRPRRTAPTRHRAGLGRRADRADRRRQRGLPDPGPHPGDDRDDGGHPGHAVRRAVPARPRASPARRCPRAGTGCGSTSRWRAPGSTSTIVRMALRRETVRYDGEHFTLPLPDGPGKALQADRAPGARPTSRSTWPRSARRTSSWPARSPTAGWRSSSAPSTPPSPWRRAGRPSGRWPSGPDDPMAGFDVVPTVPVVIGDDLEACAGADARATPRCTSAAWAAGSRTSTTRWPAGWATSEAADEVQGLYLDRKHREAAAAVPLEFIDQTSLHRAAASGSRDRLRRLRRGRGDHADASRRSTPTLDAAARTRSRTMAEVLDESGLGA